MPVFYFQTESLACYAAELLLFSQHFLGLPPLFLLLAHRETQGEINIGCRQPLRTNSSHKILIIFYVKATNAEWKPKPNICERNSYKKDTSMNSVIWINMNVCMSGGSLIRREQKRISQIVLWWRLVKTNICSCVAQGEISYSFLIFCNVDDSLRKHENMFLCISVFSIQFFSIGFSLKLPFKENMTMFMLIWFGV